MASWALAFWILLRPEFADVPSAPILGGKVKQIELSRLTHIPK